MRRLAAFAAIAAALAAAAPAQAETYNGNNLSNGQNVCAVNPSVVQGFGNFYGQISMASGGGGECAFTTGGTFYSTDALCSGYAYRMNAANTAIEASDHDPASGLANCPVSAHVADGFRHWGGTARFRFDLTGFAGIYWNACGFPIGTGCTVTDATLGTLKYDCEVGPNHKVKDCTFRRDA